MDLNRRSLLQGLSTSALLAPYLALGRALATEPTSPAASAAAAPADAQVMADEHMETMSKVLGPGLWAQEQIGMLLYPQFTALDLVGPHYFFACLFGAKVHLLSTEADLRPVMSDLGLAITPTATLASAPPALDVLFIPGGTDGTLSVMRNPELMRVVSARAAQARWVTSVCTGSMILAKTGLLKGRRATSHWAVRAALADFGAVPADERVVRDGKFLTGAGVSAGLDFALALVELLRGRAYAQALMLQAEYAPQPPFVGGTLGATPQGVATMMDQMFSPVAAQFRALAAR